MALARARACQQQRESRRLTRAPRSPPLAQVRKEDFDNAIKSAQEALRAKTSSSQMMLEQASSAMRNAVSALSLSEQEVANLRAVVKELKEGQDGASGNEAVNRERAQLRAAQQRVQELSQNFRALQNEVARMRYEQEGVDMPVAAKFPVRIDPMLSSKVVVIAQLVMLGYSYADSEDAVDAVRVHDTELALEWLEGRNVRKTSMLPENRFKLESPRTNKFRGSSPNRSSWSPPRERTRTPTRNGRNTRAKPAEDLLKGPTSPRERTSPRSILPTVRQSRPLDPEFANAAKHRRPEHRGPYNAADLYRARKRAVTVLSECAENPPPGLSRPNQLRRQTDAMAALTRLTEGVGAHLLVQLGCIRVATRVMQREANNKRVVLLCLDMIRGLLVNPLSIVHAARSRGFEEMPRAICQVVDKYHADDMDACGAAAATLWPAATVGKRPAQDAIVDAGAVDFHRAGAVSPQERRPLGGERPEAHRVPPRARHPQRAGAGDDGQVARPRPHPQGPGGARAHILQGRVLRASRLDKGRVYKPDASPERSNHRPLRLQAAVEESLVAAGEPSSQAGKHDAAAELDAQVAGRWHARARAAQGSGARRSRRRATGSQTRRDVPREEAGGDDALRDGCQPAG